MSEVSLTKGCALSANETGSALNPLLMLCRRRNFEKDKGQWCMLACYYVTCPRKMARTVRSLGQYACHYFCVHWTREVMCQE